MSPSKQKRLIALAQRQARELLALADDSEADVIIQDLADDLEPLLVQALLTNSPDEPITRAKVRRILAVLGLLAPPGFAWSERFGRSITSALVTRVSQSALLVSSHLRAQLRIVYPPLDWVSVPRETVAAWLARAEDWGRRFRARVAEDVRRQFLIALSRGETLGRLVARLLPRRNRKTATRSLAAEIAQGLAVRQRGATGRLLQTETSSAYHAGVSDTLEAQGTDFGGNFGRRWDAVLDRKVCAQCRALDGVIMALGSPFPGGVSDPPAHPFCRCVVTLWST